MIKIRRSDNCDIVSPDPERLATWYHKTLGLPWLKKWDAELGMAAVTVGNFDIFFLKTNSKDRGFKYTGDPENEPAGPMSLGFMVEDCRQAVSELKDQVEWATELHDFEFPNSNGWLYSYLHFYDPDGNMLHLTEPRNMPELEDNGSPSAASEIIRKRYADREPLAPKS